MSFDRLLLESLDDISLNLFEERERLSGNFNGFSFKTQLDPERGLFEIDIRSRKDGFVGTIEIDLQRQKIIFLNSDGKVVKTERGNRVPTKKLIQEYFIPELLKRVQL